MSRCQALAAAQRLAADGKHAEARAAFAALGISYCARSAN